MFKTKKAYILASIKYRGNILHNCTKLEKLIDHYISHTFSSDKDTAGWINTLLLDRMSFDSKISTYEQILKHQFLHDFKKKCGKLMSELRIIKEERNIFAHYILFENFEKTNIPKDVTFIGFRNSVGFKIYTMERVEDVIQRIFKCVEVIELLDIEPQREADKSGSPSAD